MRMRPGKYFLQCILVLFGCCLYGQAPGYMGKRLVAGYGFNFSPMLNGANAMNQTLKEEEGNAVSGKFRLNTIHQAFIEYAIKKKTSIGLNVGYFRTGYDNRQPVGKYGNPKDFYIINNLSVSLNSKFFFRHGVAPWGAYFNMGLIANVSLSSNHEFMYLSSTVKDRDTLLFDFGPATQRQINYDVLLGFGNSRVFADKFTLDYGFNTQLISLLKALGETDYSAVTKEDYIRLTTKERIQGLTRFNVFIKLGYLF